ncbi:MAG: Hsp20/alpha crystallin family protein [Pseudomonadales bacterium]|jgi:HSP20 family protein
MAEDTAKTSETPAPADKEIKVTEAPESASGKSTLTPFSDIEQEVERAFERFFRRGWLPSFRELPASLPLFRDDHKMPRMNVIDRDDELVVEAELPGVKKADIDVSLSGDSITIKATTYQKTEKEGDEKGEYHRREIARGLISRTMTLPSVVDPAKASATFEDGLLRVTLPKSDRAKRQSVPIS